MLSVWYVRVECVGVCMLSVLVGACVECVRVLSVLVCVCVHCQ